MEITNHKFQITNKLQYQNYNVPNRLWNLVIGILVLFVIWCLEFGNLAEAREVFLGVFREGAPRNMGYIQQFEQQVGKKPAMIMWYQDWAQEFPKEDALNVINYGAVPHIVWEPWYWSDRNKVKLKDIIAGKWDGYLRSWAQGIKEFKYPIFLRVGHEFNLGNYPWGIVNNEKDPEVYIQAYRHVVEVFKKEKAENVKWIWAPNNYSFPDEPWNDWAKAYPGDAYVDWIGFDGYNWGTTQSWSQWQVFKYLFRDQMRRARKLWPNKPIMIAEFASTEQGGDKAAWIAEIPGYLKISMRDIDVMIWFDREKETNWQLASSSSALSAFREIMKDPLFASSGEGLANLRVSLEAGKKQIAVAIAAGRPIAIDGKLKDWNKSFPMVMKDKSFFKEGLNWKGLSDLSGKAYLMWDESNLYFAAEITDKIPLVNKKERQDIWNGDAIEIVLSADPSANPRREAFERGDYQVGFGTGDGKANKPAIWNWQRRRSPQGSEISVKKIDKPLGYILEAKVPWSFFGSFVPSAGTKVGFDIAFDDADYTGERERQFVWNGDYYFYKDPSVWGILEFR